MSSGDAGDKRGVPAYLPRWPDWPKLHADAEKKPRRARRGRIGLFAGAALALMLLWHVDPIVALPFLLGLIPILRSKNPPHE